MGHLEMLREVETPHGIIRYQLIYKKIKNLNLRVGGISRVVVSVPPHCPPERADQFVREKSDWIMRRLTAPQSSAQLLPEVDRKECGRLLSEAVLRVYPLVKEDGVPLPELRIRKMKSQWGNCHYRRGYITLNTALARCPEELRDYVALHELVHFLHHDHGPGFRGAMDARMPDWEVRRKTLRCYVQALIPSDEHHVQ